MQDFHRKIKSFVLREGRMTDGQALAYESMMPRFGFVYQPQLLDFQQLFGNNNPVTLEIGFGMGASLAQQAAANPHHNYIGIEVHRPGVGSLLSRMQQADISNIRVISHDATEVLASMVKDGSLQCLQLFFPDPWHKRKHHKRRIVKAEFAQQVQQKLSDGGVLHMATDWQDYARYMHKVMQLESGWNNLSATNDYVPQPDTRPTTKFQKRGERLGHGVWDLMYAKQTLQQENK